MKNVLYIFGCGGHARSIINSIKNDYKITLVDSNCMDGERILGCDTIRMDEFLESKNNKFNFIIGIGNNHDRKNMYERAIMIGGNPVSVYSKSALLGIEKTIGNGVFIAEKVYLGPQVTVGCNSIINTGTVIEHETQIGRHTHIAPQSVVCGRCRIGDNVFVGAGSTIIDKITIVDDVVIGAGSVVTNNIFEKGTYVGCPARKLHD